MRLNWNIFREIILIVESDNISLLASKIGAAPEVIQEHVRLTVEAGLVQSNESRTQRGQTFYPTGLTIAGHDFAELARSDDRWFGVWREIHEKLGKDGGVTLDILKELLIRKISSGLGNG